MSDRSEPRDGQFTVEYADGYAQLTVLPPEGPGRPVYVEEVFNRMRILGVPTSCVEAVHGAVHAASGRPVRLIEWPDGARLTSQIDVQITADEMQATVRIFPPRKGGGFPTAQTVLNALVVKGVEYGILTEEIHRIIDTREFSRDFAAARGKPAVSGKPRRIEYTFETRVGKPYIIYEDGRIDLKELNFIQNKREGDVLARVIPPEPPEDGKTIMGAIIPAEKAPMGAAVTAGENTCFDEEAQTIVAAIDGNAYIKNNAICMESVVTVKRVDYETGNIYFDGSVVITESIADGFTVKAGGTVEIGQCVGRATVEADREVIFKGGINGDHEGTVRSGGDIIAKFIENARVSCGRNLLVQELVLHSDYVVAGCVIMKGKRAELIGGNGIVGRSLWCKQIGNMSEVPTRISVGILPETLKAFIYLKEEIDKKQIEDMREIIFGKRG